jgi:hypothetical protein
MSPYGLFTYVVGERAINVGAKRYNPGDKVRIDEGTARKIIIDNPGVQHTRDLPTRQQIVGGQ